MTKGFTAEDLYRFALVRDVALSPDGKEIAYELKTIDRKKDDYRSAIWIAEIESGRRFQLTGGSASEGAPRWSPDGRRLAFLSNRSGLMQVHVIDRNGGEARCLPDPEHGAMSCQWSPDGRHLLVGASVDREERPEGCSKEVWRNRPNIVNRQRYKTDGTGYLLKEVSRLFVVDVEGGGKPVQIGYGESDLMGAGWSPDGSQIVFSRTRPGIRDAHLSDIWIADRDGRNPRQLTDQVPSASSPVWSPDGRWILFKGNTDPGDSMMQLWLIDVQKGIVRPISTEFLEVSSYPLARIAPPVWSADSRRVAFLYSRRGLSEVATVDVDDGRVQRIFTGPVQWTNLHGSADRLVFYGHAAAGPDEIAVSDWHGEHRRTVVRPNEAFWSERTLPRVELRSFAMPDGSPVEGWLWTPADGGAPHPLLVDVHGGPHSFAEFGFPYHVYWWVLVSQGWAVLALNPVGSSSYGPEFAKPLRCRWGELDLPQHLAAVEQLQRDGVATDQVAIAGKSYGGYMAAWAIGHTKVFKAAIASAPVTNLESHVGTSDSGYYVDPHDFGGEPHESTEVYRRLSPVQYAHEATTPTLILQGEDDARCPIGQAEELYSRLMRRGRAPVEMVVFPAGHHDLAEDGRPSHRLEYHRRAAQWCERWARGQQAEQSATPKLRRVR